MKFKFGLVLFANVSLLLSIAAQTTSGPASATGTATMTAQVPRLVRLSGVVTNLGGPVADSALNPAGSGTGLARVVGITFSLYSEQTGGAPLWSEVQNVQVDATGHYTAMLGSSQPDGLPLELFTGAQAQWLGVRVEAQAEQPRIMLLSVPYALKAADAETFGGKPPSAFMPASGSDAGSGTNAAAIGPIANIANFGVKSEHPLGITGSGTTSYVPLWTNPSTLASSGIYQSPTNGWIGIGTVTPSASLEVDGKSNSLALVVSSGNTLPAISTFNNSGGFGMIVSVMGAGNGIQGSISGPGFGIFGNDTGTNGVGVGVEGSTSTAMGAGVGGDAASSTAFGVSGTNTATTGGGVGVSGTAAGPKGFGVFGVASDTTGQAVPVGVDGQADGPTGLGVSGYAASTTGMAIGVEGETESASGSGGIFINQGNTGNAIALGSETSSSSGVGLYSIGYGKSNTGMGLTDRPLGVWGDTNQDGMAVVGTSDDAFATAGINNSSSLPAGYFENDTIDSHIAPVIIARNPEYHGLCEMDASGDLTCTGTKSAVVPVDGGSRKVLLYAVEAPENWFEDFGSGQLSNGAAVIHLEPTFAQTVNSEVEYHVFLTPTGDCKGLYVASKTANGFEVHELGGGTSSVGFDYRIVARRKGYEDVRLADRTAQFDPAKWATIRAGRSAAAGHPPQPINASLFSRKVTRGPAAPTINLRDFERSLPKPPAAAQQKK